MDFPDPEARPNEQHGCPNIRRFFALAGVDRDHLRGEAKRRPRAPLTLHLSGFRPRREVGVAAYRSHDTKTQGERRARYGVLLLRAEHRDAPLQARGGPCGRGGIIVVCR
jgi:hypothetical protein